MSRTKVTPSSVNKEDPGAEPDRGSGKRMPTAADAGTVDELPGLRVEDVEDAGVVDGDTFPAWTSADGV